MRPVYLALIHHPVRDRGGAIITTAVTNLDVHDIARSARTYDLAGYFIVTPVAAQRALVERILEHWRGGPGSRRVPERTVALSLVRLASSLDDVVAEVTAEAGVRPKLFATSARADRATIAIAAARAMTPAVLVFGTGHGLAPEIVAAADGLLPPIRPTTGYNHLSVRAAAAILLDRMFGDV
jgi:tRNA (guanine37-N1)-methyltransferase